MWQIWIALLHLHTQPAKLLNCDRLSLIIILHSAVRNLPGKTKLIAVSKMLHQIISNPTDCQPKQEDFWLHRRRWRQHAFQLFFFSSKLYVLFFYDLYELFYPLCQIQCCLMGECEHFSWLKMENWHRIQILSWIKISKHEHF